MSKTLCHFLIVALLCGGMAARGADVPAKFLGAASCASSGCHGGGGEHQNQFLAWSLKDFHSQRPVATLTTARSKQIGEALGIKDPTADARCTTCHAPLQDVSADLRGDNFKVGEGVSCESCHGPSENWLRAHTRHDYTRADRTAAGMRDLQNLYVRANTCVACHQVVSQPLSKAGHPELIFELDGQSVAEPKHWSAEKNGNGAQAWFVGQAVALREMSWQLDQAHAFEAGASFSGTNLVAGCYAVAWLLHAATADNADVAKHSDDFAALQQWADTLASEKAAAWSDQLTQDCLTRLANTSASFPDSKIPQPVQARRAERLVLALDRLLAAQNNHKADAELNQLFKLAQSVPDFDPAQFAAALEKFATALSAP
ncbi:MAG TPA: multiheme c-type cytochrome [Verrucomicrobiae bacterium]|nr:multiheme c-type cytochrome [Verrucomicrobiae bacterium]